MSSVKANFEKNMNIFTTLTDLLTNNKIIKIINKMKLIH